MSNTDIPDPPKRKEGHPKGKPRDEAKLCGAVNRYNGLPCRHYALENGRCRFHGGMSVRGHEVARFKTGRYSKYMPKDITARYEAAATDPNLLALDDEIGMITVIVEEALINGADNPDDMQWGSIVELIERKRRLVDTERKRRVELLQNMTVEQAIILVRAIEGIIKEHVSDPHTLEAVSRDFERLLGPGSGPPATR